jgi:Beta-propeller repeat
MRISWLVLPLPLLFTGVIPPGGVRAVAPPVPQHGRVSAHASFGALPLSFELNRGQSDSRVKFLAHSSSYALFLTSTDAVLATFAPARTAPTGPDPLNLGKLKRRAPLRESLIRLHPLGAVPHPRLVGLDRLPGTVNYFIGNDPQRWHTDIPTYARVSYRSIYPGIDLVYYGRQGHLESDWVLRAGANPATIRLRVEGARPLRLDGEGNLVLQSRPGTLIQSKPSLYQQIGRTRQSIAGRYALLGPHEVGFTVASYDVTRPLIIDPVLLYSTYVGGSGSDQSTGLALDGTGDAYITGSTNSTNFPIANARQAAATAPPDAFVAKLNSAGSGLIYSTYLGGAGDDAGNGIAIDSQGAAFVTGDTKSADFPTVNGLSIPKDCSPSIFAPPGSHLCSEYKGFVAKLNPTGDGLVFSTYLSGNCCDDFGIGIATDNAGNAYVTGLAFSDDFPTTPGAFQTTHRGFTDAFVTKFGAIGNLIYSTYLGGDNFEGGLGIAVDGSGNAYIAGFTDSTNFPTANPSQAALGGNCPGGDTVCPDAFVAKLSPDGRALVYSTYLGGQDEDRAFGVALDNAGNAYVTGTTKSVNFPTDNPLSGSNGGGSCKGSDGSPTPCTDAFVAKFSAAGARVYSTYLGGAGNDQGNGIAVDSAGDAFVVGSTDATNFPVANAFQPAPGGGSCTDGSGNAVPCSDAFVVELDPAGAGLVYSTYLGGPGNNTGSAIALDGAGNAYVTGATSSAGFPVKGTFQASSGGTTDAFLAKIGEPPAKPTPVPPTATHTPLLPVVTPTLTPTATPPIVTPTFTRTVTPKSLHVAVSGVLRANHLGTLRVTVSDPEPAIQPGGSSSGPLAGVNVRLDARSVGIKTALKTITNGQGVATFRKVHPLRPGVATLKVSKTGFASVTRRVRVSS